MGGHIFGHVQGHVTSVFKPYPLPTGSGAAAGGDIAEVGVWDIDLTAAEVASLAKGVSPALVRPQSLVTYLPLIRDVIDVRAANGFTDVNTTAANHPRVYR